MLWLCKAKSTIQEGEGIYNNLISCMHVCACIFNPINSILFVYICGQVLLKFQQYVAVTLWSMSMLADIMGWHPYILLPMQHIQMLHISLLAENPT